MALLLTVVPHPGVCGAISPLADSDAVHLAIGPLAVVLPALLLADEQALALLEAFHVLALIVVAVAPLSDAQPTGQTHFELAREAFRSGKKEFPVPVHLALLPVALVLFAVLPGLHSVAVRQPILDFAVVATLLLVVEYDFCILAREILFGFEVAAHDLDDEVLELDHLDFSVVDVGKIGTALDPLSFLDSPVFVIDVDYLAVALGRQNIEQLVLNLVARSLSLLLAVEN